MASNTDPGEESELYLYRASNELLKELHDAVPALLYRHANTPSSHVTAPLLRKKVRLEQVDRILRLLAPFQELPQLLDPHLESLLAPLDAAYVQFTTSAKRKTKPDLETSGHDGRRIPLELAIDQILYAFCKTRGLKVIVRFWDNAPHLLVPMLDKYKMCRKAAEASIAKGGHGTAWEQDYIALLHFWHLLLTPFDLAALTGNGDSNSTDKDNENTIALKGLVLPVATPSVASRLVQIAIEKFGAAGKVRDAAVLILVRLMLRPDMQKIELDAILVEWALGNIRDVSATPQNNQQSSNIYILTSNISFLAKFIKGADNLVQRKYLTQIFQTVYGICETSSTGTPDLLKSALSRKALIRLFTALSLAATHAEVEGDSQYADMILGDVIDHLLRALADNDTPVRFAASKAISIICAGLDPSMAAQVSEALLESLKVNVLHSESKSIGSDVGQSVYIDSNINVSTVDPLRWHGLVLALAQLVFRRSPPLTQLPAILRALLLALDFEQRSHAGVSIGANVRDAACFGLWSAARKYRTQELLSVPLAVNDSSNNALSSIQIIANSLVAASCGDPAGNIRRGASAALQELVGRHPDIVVDGIRLIQIVDYHAVALLSRSMGQIALTTAALHATYWTTLTAMMLSWRGIRAAAPDTRRLAAASLGRLACISPPRLPKQISDILWEQLQDPLMQQTEIRHGVFLATAAVIDEGSKKAEDVAESGSRVLHLDKFWSVLGKDGCLAVSMFTKPLLRPQLSIEGTCVLMAALAQASRGQMMALEPPSPALLEQCHTWLDLSLQHATAPNMGQVCRAAKSLLRLHSAEQRHRIIKEWISNAPGRARGDKVSRVGFLMALGALLSDDFLGKADCDAIVQLILSCLQPSHPIETRVAGLQCFTGDATASYHKVEPGLAAALMECLGDHTIDQRGDVGSWVRLQAIEVVKIAWQHQLLTNDQLSQGLTAAIATLASEKLDKVRVRAADCLGLSPFLRQPLHRNSLEGFLSRFEVEDPTAASSVYFVGILALFEIRELQSSLLQGLVTTLGGANEALLRAARGALAAYLQGCSLDMLTAFVHEMESLLRTRIDDMRLIIPILETIAFVLDLRVLDRLGSVFEGSSALFLLVAKAHYRSTIVPKLQAAIDCYGGLGLVTDCHGKSCQKLSSMLLHPFPAIRNHAADTLFSLTQDQRITEINWTQHPKILKPIVTQMRVG